MHKRYPLRSIACTLSGLLLGACSWLPWANEDVAPADNRAFTPLEIVSAGLLSTEQGERYELGITLINHTQQTLWIQVHFQTPAGLSDCLIARELPGLQKEFFACAQDVVLADVDYPVTITAYSDATQTQVFERLIAPLYFD